jgi:hypothetical protein
MIRSPKLRVQLHRPLGIFIVFLHAEQLFMLLQFRIIHLIQCSSGGSWSISWHRISCGWSVVSHFVFSRFLRIVVPWLSIPYDPPSPSLSSPLDSSCFCTDMVTIFRIVFPRVFASAEFVKQEGRKSWSVKIIWLTSLVLCHIEAVIFRNVGHYDKLR